ncbi:MarR family winged helix-turn-helix transcriptional regulator [Thiohalorhabdus methylotrophus]|uniref:MarR family winged helix-turn-helix transcriptional regulator n=1 Tax=Thiohalorhabdus methylotrophus TaxID=3242694 RepID=A0ABV4U1P8_9GAMM
MPPQDNSTDPSLGAELLSVIARLNRWATRNADLALPVAQARLLAQIDALQSARIGDLAQADHCSQPTMTTQVRRLEAAGLVYRRTDPHDARAVRISLTARGRGLLDDVRAARAAVITPLIEKLPEDERLQIRAALDTLTNLLHAAGPVPHGTDEQEEK